MCRLDAFVTAREQPNAKPRLFVEPFPVGIDGSCGFGACVENLHSMTHTGERQAEECGGSAESAAPEAGELVRDECDPPWSTTARLRHRQSDSHKHGRKR